MKDEHGMTLVELLATLALIGMIMALLSGVLINGMNASKRNTVNQQLQQEANYITEVVRNEYLRTLESGEESKVIQFETKNDILKMDGKVISEGYQYSISDVMRKQNPVLFHIHLEKDELTFETSTMFSKLE